MKIKHGINKVIIFDFEEGIIYEFLKFLWEFCKWNNLKLEEVSGPIPLRQKAKKIKTPKLPEQKKEEYILRSHDFQKWRERKRR